MTTIDRRAGHLTLATTPSAAEPATADSAAAPPVSLFAPGRPSFEVTEMTTEALAGEELALADAVSAQLEGVRRLGVAYSGGVDSAVLLALAVRALGAENVVALLGVSPSLARR